MVQSKNKVSLAQREAQRRYDKDRTKMVSIKYTGKDMFEYLEFKKYLATHPNQSANKLIKRLIYDFLQEQKHPTNNVKKKQGDINIYEGIDKDNIENLQAMFGREVTDKILKEYQGFLQHEIIEINKKEIDTWIKTRPGIIKHSNPKLSSIGLQMYLYDKFIAHLGRIKAKIQI